MGFCHPHVSGLATRNIPYSAYRLNTMLPTLNLAHREGNVDNEENMLTAERTILLTCEVESQRYIQRSEVSWNPVEGPPL